LFLRRKLLPCSASTPEKKERIKKKTTNTRLYDKKKKRMD
jgi:hypothetical protein